MDIDTGTNLMYERISKKKEKSIITKSACLTEIPHSGYFNGRVKAVQMGLNHSERRRRAQHPSFSSSHGIDDCIAVPSSLDAWTYICENNPICCLQRTNIKGCTKLDRHRTRIVAYPHTCVTN
jgi:hypothetical protein